MTTLKVLHTGDIHYGDLTGPVRQGANLRKLDTLKCVDELCRQAADERPDLSIIAGDLFNRSRVWADTVLEDMGDMAEHLLRPLCACSRDVILLYGTENHDNMRAFESIRDIGGLENLHVVTRPELLKLDGVQVLCIPGFDRRLFRESFPGLDFGTENATASVGAGQVLDFLAAQADPGTPLVIAAHWSVGGSKKSERVGSAMAMASDARLPAARLNATGAALGCFGHIHVNQDLGLDFPAYYCGPVNQLSFSDEGAEQGFYIHEIGPGGVRSSFRPLPSRRHVTVKLNGDDMVKFVDGKADEVVVAAQVDGRICRVVYSCDDATEAEVNRAALQKFMADRGVFYISGIVRAEDTGDGNVSGGADNTGDPSECLRAWLEGNGYGGDKLKRLLDQGSYFLDHAGRTNGADKHAGLFLPRKISVENYRSYVSAAFDFDMVHMAMVNGRNGAGKSSLFMDAVADCLFEQSRGKDAGSWVRCGAKSGKIEFMFSMGSETYRVCRTRTGKSAKGTLSLSVLDTDGSWRDISEINMRATQSKIERLLGMDADAFCSVALIRQDAYGTFLDAGEDERMQVLAGLLGLGIYEGAKRLTKAAAADAKMELSKLTGKECSLLDRIDGKDTLLAEDMALAHKIEETKRLSGQTQSELDGLLRLRRGAEESAKRVAGKKKTLDDTAARLDGTMKQAAALADEITGLVRKVDGLDAAMAASRELERARMEAAELAPVVLKYTRLKDDKERVDREISDLVREQLHIKANMDAMQNLMSEKVAIEQAVARKIELEHEREAVLARQAEYNKLNDKGHELQTKYVAAMSAGRARADGIKRELQAAQKEAKRLDGAGCLDISKAQCVFLRSAIEAKAALPELEKKLADAERETETDLAAIDAKIKYIREKTIGIEDPTDALARIGREIEAVSGMASRAVDLAAAEASVNAAEERMTTVEGKLKMLEDCKNDDIRKLADLELDMAREKQARETCARLSKAEAELRACMEADGLMKVKQVELQSMRENMARMDDAIAGLEADIKAEENGFEAFGPGSRLDVDIETKQTWIKNYERNLEEYLSRRGQIEALTEAMEQAAAELVSVRKEKTAAAQKVDDLKILSSAFDVSGIPHMVVCEAVPEIGRMANDILGSMTGGRMRIEIRTERVVKSTKAAVNSLEIWIRGIDGPARPYNSHSGGEKVKIALAVALALAGTKARRAGVQLGMLFIDEPPFLDAEGTDAYADALTAMSACNPDMRVLAISHDIGMKARFAQNIEVWSDQNGSHASIV